MNGFLMDLKLARLWLRDFLFYRHCALRIDMAIRLADMRLRGTNKQQYILPIEFRPGVERLKVFDNKGFERMKRLGWIPKRMNYYDLLRSCVYVTPHSRVNKTSAEERKKAREQYLKYARKYLRGKDATGDKLRK